MTVIKQGNGLRIVRYEKGEKTGRYRDTWGTGYQPQPKEIDRVISLGAERYGKFENHLGPSVGDEFLFTIEMWNEPEANEFGPVTP